MTIIAGLLTDDECFLAADTQATRGGKAIEWPRKYEQVGNVWFVASAGFIPYEIVSETLQPHATGPLSNNVMAMADALRKRFREDLGWELSQHAAGGPSCLDFGLLLTDGASLWSIDGTLLASQVSKGRIDFDGTSELAEGAFAAFQRVEAPWPPEKLIEECLRVECEISVYCGMPIDIIRVPKAADQTPTVTRIR